MFLVPFGVLTFLMVIAMFDFYKNSGGKDSCF